VSHARPRPRGRAGPTCLGAEGPRRPIPAPHATDTERIQLEVPDLPPRAVVGERGRARARRDRDFLPVSLYRERASLAASGTCLPATRSSQPAKSAPRRSTAIALNNEYDSREGTNDLAVTLAMSPPPIDRDRSFVARRQPSSSAARRGRRPPASSQRRAWVQGPLQTGRSVTIRHPSADRLRSLVIARAHRKRCETYDCACRFYVSGQSSEGQRYTRPTSGTQSGHELRGVHLDGQARRRLATLSRHRKAGESVLGAIERALRDMARTNDTLTPKKRTSWYGRYTCLSQS
jgi:hypothetical protein